MGAAAVRRLLRGGTLGDVLARRERLTESRLRIVARRVLVGLHNMKTSAQRHHFDIKPANIGLLHAGKFKSTVIFDFGSALPLGAVRCPLVVPA